PVHSLPPPFPYTTLFRSMPAVFHRIDNLLEALEDRALRGERHVLLEERNHSFAQDLSVRDREYEDVLTTMLRKDPAVAEVLLRQDRKSTRLNSSHVSISY